MSHTVTVAGRATTGPAIPASPAGKRLLEDGAGLNVALNSRQVSPQGPQQTKAFWTGWGALLGRGRLIHASHVAKGRFFGYPGFGVTVRVIAGSCLGCSSLFSRSCRKSEVVQRAWEVVPISSEESRSVDQEQVGSSPRGFADGHPRS